MGYKAFSAIFRVVTPSEFRCISNCEIAQDAWDILMFTHEGTQTAKESKLQALTMRFEECRMVEYETFDQSYARLSDIVPATFSVGETIIEGKKCEDSPRPLLGVLRPRSQS